MEKINIIDDSGDRDFFTIIPNVVINHSTAIDRGLYIEMKRYAGEDGLCFATEKTMMKRLGIGKKSFDKSLTYLIGRKWISFVGMTDGKTRPIKTYKVNNIWKENSDWKNKISSERTLSFKGDKSQKEGDKFQKQHKISSESNVEEEPVKEEPYKECVATLPSSKIFKKPSLEEIQEYCIERNNGLDHEQFFDFYESKGWKVGSQGMKDWRAAVRTWEKRTRGNNDNPINVEEIIKQRKCQK